MAQFEIGPGGEVVLWLKVYHILHGEESDRLLTIDRRLVMVLKGHTNL